MPGSSVSACHLCHLHSHNHDNLVRTSPLRHSRGRNKSSSSSSKYSNHRHHHNHTNSSYSSRDEAPRGVTRTNSASALARLTDNSHSLPGSRSNSLSRYHREVSILPDGGDTYGRGLRPSTSTRSLDINPPITSLLGASTTSLPRVSTPRNPQPQIHAQPDLLVNAMPRSRTNSRSGSLPRNPASLGQETSQDYYLDMHRQRFKEEKRKHSFNLQTVMLIGCYTLLVMIAIVVGVVLCYQNGWLGLGPPQGKYSGERTYRNNSDLDKRNSIDLKNRRKPPDLNVHTANNDERIRLINRENANLNLSPPTPNGGDLNPASSFPSNVHRQIPETNEDQFNNQRNVPRLIPDQGSNRNRGQLNQNDELLSNHRNIQDGRQRSFPINTHGNQEVLINQSQDPRLRQNANGEFIANLPNPDLRSTQRLTPNSNVHNNRGSGNTNLPSNFQTGIPLNVNTNLNNNNNNDFPNRPSGNGNNQFQTPNQQQIPSVSNVVPLNRGNINGNTNGNAPSNFQTGIPLHTNFNVNGNSGFNNAQKPNSNDNFPASSVVHSQRPSSPNDPTNTDPFNGNLPSNFQTGIPLSSIPNLNPNSGFTNGNAHVGNTRGQPLVPFGSNPTIRQGNLDSNTIAKTLLRGGFSLPGFNGPNANIPSSNSNQHLVDNKNINNQNQFLGNTEEGSSATSIGGKVTNGDTNSLSTQELLDLLAIRRMRDLLNTKGNARNILDLLQNGEPPEGARLEQLRQETLSPPGFKEGIQGDQDSSRGSGRSIKGIIRSDPNDFQIHELIQALNNHNNEERIPIRNNLNPPDSSQINGRGGFNNRPNVEGSERTPINSPNIDDNNPSLNNLINRTINGAIIQLLNNRVNDMKKGNIDPNLNFNVSGVTVFPVNSEDLRILLDSNPANIRDNIGPLSDKRIRSLQLLQTLIELNNERQKVQRDIHSSTTDTQNADNSDPREEARTSFKEFPQPSESRFEVPTPKLIRGSPSSTSVTHPQSRGSSRGKSISSSLPLRNVTSTFNRGSTDPIGSEKTKLSGQRRPSPSSRLRGKQANPSYALMVKGASQTTTPPPSKVVFPPPFKRQETSRRKTERDAPPPIKEQVAIQAGRRKSRGSSALVRAWTHMDSSGTLSKGRVHSDGSFTFTNCRPIEVCDNSNKKDDKKNN